MKQQEDADLVEIDVHSLDSEWQAQPRLMHQASRKLAEARSDERDAAAKLKLVEAELGLAIRRTPERYGFSKAPSNDVVDACVLVQKEYRLALQELNKSKYDVEVIEAVVSALSHKKAALESMVVLWCRDYGAECKLPREYDPAARAKMERAAGDRWKGATRDVE